LTIQIAVRKQGQNSGKSGAKNRGKSVGGQHFGERLPTFLVDSGKLIVDSVACGIFTTKQ
jgi:hypothetical protein